MAKSKNPKQLTPGLRESLANRIQERTPRFPLNAERSSIERRWLRSYHYYNGRHFIKWNSGSGKFEKDSSDRFRKEYVANLIKPTVRRTVAKLVGNLPVARVAPETEDVADRAASRLAEKALTHLWDTTGFQTVTERVSTHMAVCGTGFYKVWWNPQAGPLVKFYRGEDGNRVAHAMTMDEKTEAEAAGRTEMLAAGDVAIDYVSPFKIMVDPDITSGNLANARWVCEISIQRKTHMEEIYGKNASEISYDDNVSQALLSEQLRTELPMASSVATTDHPEEERDPKCLVKEYWEKPSVDFPEGLHVVEAGDHIVEYGPNFYHQIGTSYPYIAQHWDADPEKFWVQGLVSQLTEIQEEYNRSRSQIIENKDLMSKPIWLVPKGSDISEASLTSRPGEIVEFNPNFPAPQQNPAAPLPTYVSEHIERCLNEFQIIAADRDPTQAKTPSALRSGVAINLIDERDRTTLAPTMSSIHNAIKDVGRASLMLMGEMYDEPRLIKTSGDNYTYEVMALLGSDLRENYDVRIYVESGAGESKAGRQQAILDYVQLGILNPIDPNDKKVILKALEYGDPQDYISEMLQDERRAEIENESMRQGGQALMYPWDDHEVHIKAHRRFMKTEGFARLPDQVKEQFMQHLGFHDQELAKLVQAQIAAEAQSRGGPGEKGKPSLPGRDQQ